MAEFYIYNGDAEKNFYEKLNSLHNKYVRQLLLSGVASKGADLESIKFTKSPDSSENLCRRVVGGLKNVSPSIILKLVEDKKTRLECIFTWLNDGDYLQDELFMIQNVMDWPQLDKFSGQVWYLGKETKEEIRKHLS